MPPGRVVVEQPPQQQRPALLASAAKAGWPAVRERAPPPLAVFLCAPSLARRTAATRPIFERSLERRSIHTFFTHARPPSHKRRSDAARPLAHRVVSRSRLACTRARAPPPLARRSSSSIESARAPLAQQHPGTGPRARCESSRARASPPPAAAAAGRRRAWVGPARQTCLESLLLQIQTHTHTHGHTLRRWRSTWPASSAPRRTASTAPSTTRSARAATATAARACTAARPRRRPSCWRTCTKTRRWRRLWARTACPSPWTRPS